MKKKNDKYKEEKMEKIEENLTQNERLKYKTLISYSIGHLGQISIFTCIGLYLVEYYINVIKLKPYLVGIAHLIPILIDAITDPIMGFISDNTTWFKERRRPYFLIGAIPAGFLFFLVFNPPINATQTEKCIYLTIMLSLLFIFFTIFETPYTSLAPELTLDYNERIRLSAYRRFMESCGEVLGVFTLPILLFIFTTSNILFCYRLLGIIIGCVVILSGIIVYLGTWERPSKKRKSEYPFFKGLLHTLKNKAFVFLIISFALTMMADRIVMAQLIIIMENFYHKTKEHLLFLFSIFYLGSLSSVPIWMKIGKKVGKKVCYIIAMFFYAITFSTLVINKWSDIFLYCLAFLGGIANAGLYMMPLALAPDIIEIDQLKTKQRREGAYMGVWTFILKTGMAISLLLVGIILSLIGYEGGKTPSPQTLIGLRISFGLIPGCMLLIAGIIFSFFPITKQKHEEILKELKIRQEQGEEIIFF